jgi:hypothetical protein
MRQWMTQPNQFETVNGFARDTITLANWRTRPYSFWSFRNVSEMVRSARIATSDPRALPAIARNQEALTQPAWPGAEQSTAELLARAQTDSIVVSRKGRDPVGMARTRRRPQRPASGLLDLQVHRGPCGGHS